MHINFDDLSKYKFVNSLILIDEITLDADNRNFKNFNSAIRDFFLLHRHLGLDIIYATQNYENVDKKIRDVTNDLWYMSKSVVPILRNFTTSKKIYRKININEHTSELTLGYRFCNFIESLFAKNFEITFRPFTYKYFDSFDELNLSDRPLYTNTKKASIPKGSILYYLNKIERKKCNE
ncbi:MAG: zonular occludens toxin domain-containing protein [Bacilli bacterium]|nr:zonular occludens toxin domain-containing protein [Bacilli bacterium]